MVYDVENVYVVVMNEQFNSNKTQEINNVTIFLTFSVTIPKPCPS